MTAAYTTRISSIGNIDLILRNEANICSTPCTQIVQKIQSIANIDIVVDDSIKFLTTGLRLKKSVETMVGRNESATVILILKLWGKFELIPQMVSHELRNFRA